MLRASQIQSISRLHGLELVHVLPAAEAQERLTREASRLSAWQTAGYAGEMDYLKRPPALFTDLNNFIDGPEAVLLFAIPYHAATRGALSRPPGSGRVARYAWGQDYHLTIKRRLRALAAELQNAASAPFATRIFTDAVPLLERSLAQQAGLGFIGKHSLLIGAGQGSYFFLAEILVGSKVERDVELPHRGSRASWFRRLERDEASRPGSGCGSCTRCLTACPTRAIVGDGIVDARRCISYLTIEKRTAFSESEAEAIGDWIFGCDLCQDVCPFNGRTPSGPVFEEFGPAHGVGPLLDLTEMLTLRTGASFKRRFENTALLRPGRAALLRNACAVIANTGFEEAAGALCTAALEDPADLVRGQAVSALVRLKPRLSGAVLRQAEAVIGRRRG